MISIIIADDHKMVAQALKQVIEAKDSAEVTGIALTIADAAGQLEEKKPDLVVIDSIQTMTNDGLESASGSVSQVRESTATLMRVAKGMGISIFIVGHVTKDGAVAGPKVLEHMVDTVLYFEGDLQGSYRILRAVKNRFGSTNEIGVFEMSQGGLKEVKNPSEYPAEP